MKRGASSKKPKKLIGREDFGILKNKNIMRNYQEKVNPFLFVDKDCSKEFYS